MNHVLIVAEHDNKDLRPAYFNTVTAALELGEEFTVLVAGYECQTVVEAIKKHLGVQNILVADAADYAYFLAENMAALIAGVCRSKNYTHLLMPATHFAKDLMPRVAGLLDVAVISDVVEIIDADTFVRSLCAGTALATVYSVDSIKLLTVRMMAFAARALPDTNNVEIPIELLSTVVINSSTWLIKQALHASERPELTSARIVVAGGRALQNAENFKLLESIAHRLNAALGASRAAIDAGCIGNDCQVGQTGKIVAPDLYFAVGISGAMHHLAGMSGSKVIVAINWDAHAPIFEVADYGLVANLFTVLPLLEEALKKF